MFVASLVIWLLILPVLLIIGLARPDMFRPVLHQHTSRKLISLVIFTLFIVAFGVSLVTVPPTSKKASGAAQGSAVPGSKTQPSRQTLPPATSIPPGTPAAAPTERPTASEPSQFEECLKEFFGPDRSQCWDYLPKLDATFKMDSVHVFITSNEKVQWDACTLSVNGASNGTGGFSTDIGTIQPGQTISAPWTSLTSSDGTRFNYYKTAPQNIDLLCYIGKQQYHTIFQ